MRAKRLRFAIIPEVTVTDAEADLFHLKIEKLIQFFRKYITESDKASMFVNCEKKSNSTEPGISNIDGNLSNKDRHSEKEKEKGRKKKVDVNLLKIWLGTQGDPKWAFLQCDRIVSTKRVMHIEVDILISVSPPLFQFLFLSPLSFSSPSPFSLISSFPLLHPLLFCLISFHIILSCLSLSYFTSSFSPLPSSTIPI